MSDETEPASDDLATLRKLREKLAAWANAAPTPTTLEEVRMLREAIAAEIACVRAIRDVEDEDVDGLPPDKLRQKVREMMDRGLL